MDEISVFGATGFVGGEYCAQTNLKPIKIARESRMPLSDDSVYFISTTHNYHVFDDVHKDIDTNLTILVDVLENLKDRKGVFNFISSWFVYGQGNLPAKEDAFCQPKGFYSITKYAAENLIESYCNTFNIKYRILRLCNVYGKSDSGVSKKKNALQFLIDKLRCEEEIGLYEGGDFYRDYMHVEDIARAVDLVIKKGEINQIYNIGTGEKILFSDVINMARNIIGSSSKVNSIPTPDFHKLVQIKNFYMDTSKLKNLGFEPKFTLEEGIKTLCH
ncbi:MAG: NAD-dependent epimerase/dehydratase family protein [Oligoflexales bacterium]